jgi:ComF family protein
MIAAHRSRVARSAVRHAADAIVAACLAPCCAACERVLETPLSGSVCDVCWNEARLAGGRYDGALRRIIQAFKYDGRASLAEPLGALLRERGVDILKGTDAVVPVPLFATRRLRRGFNQASLLARHLERPVVHALWRVRATSPQAGLTATGRARNVRGTFRLAPWVGTETRRTLIENRIVVLVDDVLTTGATLDACAEALAAAGPREIRRLTLAAAPLRGSPTRS